MSLSVLLHFKTIILDTNIFAMLLFDQAFELAPVSALIASEAVEQAVLAHAKRVHVRSLFIVWLGTNRAVSRLNLIAFVLRLRVELRKEREHFHWRNVVRFFHWRGGRGMPSSAAAHVRVLASFIRAVA